MALTVSSAGADGMLNGDSLGAQCNGGYVRIFTGTLPAHADAPLVGGNVMMAESRFPATAFAAPLPAEIYLPGWLTHW